MENKPLPNSSRPVMDIRPRAPLPQPAVRTPAAPARPAQVDTPATPTVASAPTTDVETQPAALAKPPAESTDKTTPSDQQPIAQPAASLPTELPHVKAPVAAIVIALLVGSGLMALTVFAYIKNQQKETAGRNTTSTATAVEPAEVDTVNQAMDEELTKLNDTEDFSDAQLTDEALGL